MEGKKEKQGIVQEFKDFAFRGNVLDLAVAVVMGAAFNAIVTSFVQNVIMPLIGAMIKTDGLKTLVFELNGSTVEYGAFLAAIVNFFLVAIAIFILIKGINQLRRKQQAEEAEKAAEEAAAEAAAKEAEQAEVKLLTEIRDLLKSQNK